MKTYIKNIEGLSTHLGYENPGEIMSENIGYGERAVVFKNVTELCEGRTKAEKFSDFCINAEVGQSFTYKNKDICKVANAAGDAVMVYENSQGDIFNF